MGRSSDQDAENTRYRDVGTAFPALGLIRQRKKKKVLFGRQPWFTTMPTTTAV